MVATEPVQSDEVLEALNKRYNLGILPDDFAMEAAIDTIGEHFVTVTYRSAHYDQDFTFFVKIQIRPKIVIEKKKRTKK